MSTSTSIERLRELVENGPSLHSQIMNLPCDSDDCPLGGVNALLAFKHGHRDARHAAAELASEHEATIRALLDELDALRVDASRREQAFSHLIRQLDDLLWTNDYCGLEGNKHDSTAVTEAIDAARAAINTKEATPELADLGVNGSRCGTHGTSGS